MPSVIAWFLVAGTGACVGSFLNVLIHRLPSGRSVIAPRSACPSCAAPIAWHDNVPILSYLWLRGRCRRCGVGIPIRYPLVEATTALLFVLLFETRGWSAAFGAEAFLAASLVALIVIDARHQILPDAITLPGIAVGLLTSPLRPKPPEPIGDAVLGGALGFAIPWSINAAYLAWQAMRGVPKDRREDGIGQGDFKLLAMIGCFLGVKLLLFTLLIGAVSGALFGLLMIGFGGLGWKSRLPYGVFLGAAAILALFAGGPWVRWYLGLAGIGP
jgi:leader peptidase (prepilin peptidase) / N-methyltransferase